jgi:hypothetical protein
MTMTMYHLRWFWRGHQCNADVAVVTGRAVSPSQVKKCVESLAIEFSFSPPVVAARRDRPLQRCLQ